MFEAWRWDFERSWQDNLLPVKLVLHREESGRVGLRSRGRLQLQDLLEGSCSLTHVDVLLEWRGAGVVRQLATDAGLLASRLRVRLQTMQEQPVGERRRQEQGEAHVVGWLDREKSDGSCLGCGVLPTDDRPPVMTREGKADTYGGGNGFPGFPPLAACSDGSTR